MAMLAAWVLGACADSSRWLGTWRGHRDVPVGPGQDPAVAETLSLVVLTIKSDGSFELTEEGIGKSGTAHLGAQEGGLKVDRVLGRLNEGPLAGERMVRLMPDGTLSFKRPGDREVTLGRTPTSRQGD